MPVETAKEVAKVAVEASGGGLWQWSIGIVGMLGTAVAGVWGHVTGRIKTLEEKKVAKEELAEHTREQNEKFGALFDKHDEIMREVTIVGKAVARIEGKIDR